MGNSGSAPVVQQQQQTPVVIQQQQQGDDQQQQQKKGPSCKICCACPAERRVRDECVIFKGHENCNEQIEAFYTCLLKEGFSQEQVDSLRKRSQQ